MHVSLDWEISMKGTHMQVRKAATTLALILMVGLATVPAIGQTNTVLLGQTNVKLGSDFVGALGALNLAPGTVFPTRLDNGAVNFPVVGGAIELKTAKGEILHSGGLILTSSSGTKVRLQAFTIDTTTGQPFISGLVVVDGQLLGRLPLFTLQLPSGLTLPLKPYYGWITLKGVGVKLSSQAAAALNTVYGVTAFQGGFNIGTANVSLYSIK